MRSRRFALLRAPSAVIGLAVVVVVACSRKDRSSDTLLAADPAAMAPPLFSLLPSATTGVRFENRVEETNDQNVFTYRNFYNGGGVGISDLTGDGLPEIVLTSNQGGPKLFLNKGGFKFREVTEDAGLEDGQKGWSTGVAIADVNGDGRLDIYISRAGPVPPARRANQLWINQGMDSDGVPTFREMAREYGVADEGYSTQAVFLDYDRDGDLDLFLVNNSPRSVSSFAVRNTRSVRDPNGGAKLFRNDGGHFTDVSVAAGIFSPAIAFGLGVAVSDVNRDGWPDIYVSNDFFERDYLYINEHDGRFSEALDQQAPVLSYFSMGLDVADVDNDGWPDIYTTDMLPKDEFRLKSTTSFEGWEVYQNKVRNGFHHQLMRNMLQRNNRDGTFTDVGQMAGVARTDWSWSALIADMDLDGRKDIFVTNGLAKDITSQDFIAFLASDGTMNDVTRGGRTRADFSRLGKAMTTTRLANYAFRNLAPDGPVQNGIRFADETKAWGLATPSTSSGAAYGDLDGDGAPDLVVNNVNQEAFVYRNNARILYPERRVLRVSLAGEGANRFGVGARVTAYAGSDVVMQEEFPTRGFQSTVDYVLDFGLGMRYVADSLVVEWPDGRATTIRRPPLDRLVTVRQSDATALPASPSAVPASSAVATLFRDITDSVALGWKHEENAFVDFEREPLIPKLLSTEGPAMAVADVNGDGLDDVYFGGAKNQPGKLLIQRRAGTFASSSDAVFVEDAVSEDVGALFFDANGDGAPDLYVVSGGSEYSAGAPALQDRIYLNDGRGVFRKAEGYLPSESASGSRVVAADYDRDGDADLFVGGRSVPWSYGTNPQSMLLRNDGTGHFRDVTATLAPELTYIGMVTDAVWTDVNGDGRLDLVLVGDWMPITIFRNVGGGKLVRVAAPGLATSNGWWNRIIAADMNADGRVDFVVGNLGLNGPFSASERRPVTMTVNDFNNNGSVEQVIASYNGDASYPMPMRDALAAALPALESRFPRYSDYARATMEQVFTPAELKGAIVKEADTFATMIIRNNGDGTFDPYPLPSEAQLAPVYGIVAADFDHDGRLDLLLAGNFDGFKPEIGRMSSSYGLLLRGNGEGKFTPVRPAESGFRVPGQTRDIKRVRTGAGEVYVVARNNDRPLVFRALRRATRRK